jgi:hypothetical protein
MDGSGLSPRRTSFDSTSLWGGSVVEIPDEEVTPAATGISTDISAASNIIADLDALQREVDALRGQYEKASG